MTLEFLADGITLPNTAQTVLRCSMGVFFGISGFHKLFNSARHASVVETLKSDKCYNRFTEWAIPWGEFLGGLGLVVGLLTLPACMGLIAICLGATCLDGLKRIPSWGPLDKADYADDVLYLPEVLYVLILVAIMIIGPGAYSLDYYLWR